MTGIVDGLRHVRLARAGSCRVADSELRLGSRERLHPPPHLAAGPSAFQHKDAEAGKGAERTEGICSGTFSFPLLSAPLRTWRLCVERETARRPLRVLRAFVVYPFWFPTTKTQRG